MFREWWSQLIGFRLIRCRLHTNKPLHCVHRVHDCKHCWISHTHTLTKGGFYMHTKTSFQTVCYIYMITVMKVSASVFKALSRVCVPRQRSGDGLNRSEFHQTFLRENVPTVIFSLPHIHPMHTIPAHSSILPRWFTLGRVQDTHAAFQRIIFLSCLITCIYNWSKHEKILMLDSQGTSKPSFELK